MHFSRLIIAVACATATLVAPRAAAYELPGITQELRQSCAQLPAATLVQRTDVDARFSRLEVSTGIGSETIHLDVLHPDNDTPRSTLYVLPGLYGEPEGSWIERTDAREFFSDKQVNVVFVRGAAGSMMSDWNVITRLNSTLQSQLKLSQLPQPMFGSGCWEQFVGVTLPALIDASFHGTGSVTGHDMLAGISMSGNAGLTIGADHPQRFAAMASFSGFPQLTGLAGQFVPWLATTVALSPLSDLWGLVGSTEWSRHDPSTRLGDIKANGQSIYVGYGTGIIGAIDYQGDATDVERLRGAPAEWFAGIQNTVFVHAIARSGVRAHVDSLPYGTHNWSLFAYYLHASWNSTFTQVAD